MRSLAELSADLGLNFNLPFLGLKINPRDDAMFRRLNSPIGRLDASRPDATAVPLAISKAQ